MATAAEPPPGRHGGARRLRRAELLALALLVAVAAAGFVVYPAYPTYDSLYSLLWARELLDGALPTLDAHRAPTQHPLWIAVSVPAAALGSDRALLALCVASYLALVAGMYRLGRTVFGPLAGLAAALLVLGRLDFAFYAARGYVDVAYLALIVWAAVLEAQRPRRGGPVWALLILAGLLRPEAWLLAGAYGIWIAWRGPPRAWLRVAALAATAPLLWAASDLVATGSPLFSSQHTTALAEQLGRRRSLAQLPHTTLAFLATITTKAVLAAAAVGLVLAWRQARSACRVPLALLAWGVGVFLLVSLRGFAVIDRYLLAAALALMLFAAFAVTGFERLPRGHRALRWWASVGLALAIAAITSMAARVDLAYIDGELRLRHDVRRELVALLDEPAVRRGRRCGPLAVPNHKLVAELRWIAAAGVDDVLARSDPRTAARIRDGGVVVLVTGGARFLRHSAYTPYDQPGDSPLIQLPPDGYVRAVAGPRFAAYVRCRAAVSAAPARAWRPGARR